MSPRRPTKVSLFLFLFHALGGSALWRGGAAEAGAVAANGASVSKHTGFTPPNTDNRPSAAATSARVCADKFGAPAALHHDLSTLLPLLHAGDIYGLAFATNHREGVVRFNLFGLSCGRDWLVEHHHMLAALHRLHRRRFILRLTGPGSQAANAIAIAMPAPRRFFLFIDFIFFIFRFVCLFELLTLEVFYAVVTPLLWGVTLQIRVLSP